MAKEKNRYKFSGSSLNDIIGMPLVSIARAQGMMAREQVKSIMESCFYFENGIYEPIMLKMTVTKSHVISDKSQGEYGSINQNATIFYLPMITIFPITSLGIESAEIDFDIEVTAQFEKETEGLNSASDFPNTQNPGSEIMGRIRNTKQYSEKENENEHGNDISTSFHVNVQAGTLPLTKGLLEIIDIYSNTLQIAAST